VFASLARSGGHRVATGTDADGGETLAEHAGSADTAAKLASAKWGVVVLQEQSMTPSVEQFRQADMYPAARRLVSMVRAAGAEPMFFLTWAHRDGWPETGVLTDYSKMQAAIDDGYLAIAGEEKAAVAPVGYAWWTLLHQEPGGRALAGRRQPPDDGGDLPGGLRLLRSHLQAEPGRAPLRRGRAEGRSGELAGGCGERGPRQSRGLGTSLTGARRRLRNLTTGSHLDLRRVHDAARQSTDAKEQT
jgi:hypothetical protein